MKKYGFLIALCCVLIFAGSASADPSPVYDGIYVDMYLKDYPSMSEVKVYLDLAVSSTITGHVGSQTDPRLVTFSSTTDTLDAANGFATIKAKDGFINNITITAPGYWFEDLIFSVNLTPNQNDNLTITSMDKSGGIDTFSGWSTLLGNGENRIMVLSTSGNLMQSVTITSVYGIESLGGLDQLKQTEISGLTAVPEPSTMLLLGLGLLGLAGIRRKS